MMDSALESDRECCLLASHRKEGQAFALEVVSGEGRVEVLVGWRPLLEALPVEVQ